MRAPVRLEGPQVDGAHVLEGSTGFGGVHPLEYGARPRPPGPGCQWPAVPSAHGPRDRLGMRRRPVGGTPGRGPAGTATDPRAVPGRADPSPSAAPGFPSHVPHHPPCLAGRPGHGWMGGRSGCPPSRAGPVPLGWGRAVRGRDWVGRAGPLVPTRAWLPDGSLPGCPTPDHRARLRRADPPKVPHGGMAAGRAPHADAVGRARQRRRPVGCGGGRWTAVRCRAVGYPTVLVPVIWVGCTSQWKKYVPGPGKIT